MRPHPAIKRHSLWLAALLLLLLVQCASMAPAPDLQPPLAEPARNFNDLFNRSNGGWTGGDGTVSVPLSDGRSIWLFGDSFLGTVRPDGTRADATPFVRNCLVVQKGALLETRCGDKDAAFDFFPTPTADTWYWPGHGTVEGDRLIVFLHRFAQAGPRLWQWRWTGNAIACLDLPSLKLAEIVPAPSENGVLYGVSLLPTGRFIYIFGTDASGFPQQAHVARAPAGRLRGPWTYYDGGGWSPSPAATEPILAGISTQYAVIGAREVYYLFTMDARTPFSNRLVVYRARRPQGPWQGPLLLYEAPETDAHIAAYNPFVHAQFTRNGRVLVSYNLNHIDDPGALYLEAAIYRPRFVWVDLAEVDRYLDGVGGD
jgi:hypothetical protein